MVDPVLKARGLNHQRLRLTAGNFKRPESVGAGCVDTGDPCEPSRPRLLESAGIKDGRTDVTGRVETGSHNVPRVSVDVCVAGAVVAAEVTVNEPGVAHTEAVSQLV